MAGARGGRGARSCPRTPVPGSCQGCRPVLTALLLWCRARLCPGDEQPREEENPRPHGAAGDVARARSCAGAGFSDSGGGARGAGAAEAGLPAGAGQEEQQLPEPAGALPAIPYISGPTALWGQGDPRGWGGSWGQGAAVPRGAQPGPAAAGPHGLAPARQREQPAGISGSATMVPPRSRGSAGGSARGTARDPAPRGGRGVLGPLGVPAWRWDWAGTGERAGPAVAPSTWVLLPAPLPVQVLHPPRPVTAFPTGLSHFGMQMSPSLVQGIRGNWFLHCSP